MQEGRFKRLLVGRLMADLSVGTDAMKSKHIERIRAAYYEQSLTPEDSGYDQDDCDMPFMKSPPCPGDTNYTHAAEMQILANCLDTGDISEFHILDPSLFQDDLNRAIFKAMKTLTTKGEPCTHRAIAELAHLEDLADSLRP
jgi:hypothetical protein